MLELPREYCSISLIYVCTSNKVASKQSSTCSSLYGLITSKLSVPFHIHSLEHVMYIEWPQLQDASAAEVQTFCTYKHKPCYWDAILQCSPLCNARRRLEHTPHSKVVAPHATTSIHHWFPCHPCCLLHQIILQSHGLQGPR